MTAKLPELLELTPLSPSGLDVDAAAKLRQLILSGRLQPGCHLVEMQLAEQLDVSRGTVRVALRQLHEEGLVEYRRNRGIFVAQPSAQDIWEIYTLRDALESLAASLAASRIAEEGRRDLRASMAAMQAAVDTGDRRRAVELDWEFHRLVVRLSGHRRLQKTYAILESQTRLFMALTDDLHPDLSHMLPIHGPLAEAIMAGDAAAAASLAAHQNEPDGQALLHRLRASVTAETQAGTRQRTHRQPRPGAARTLQGE